VSNLFLEHSVPALLLQIADKKISFADLADACAAAIERHEPATHAWVSHDVAQVRAGAERAQKEFDAREPLRALEGMPFGIKDIFNTRTFPTEMGSTLWAGFTPGNNARVVDAVLGAGGIAAGKTVTAEFAVHALNATLNPHDAKLTPGTSSSGSAAAVARGMVPFALGTQTAGSIVRPASFCGIWGMKPSFGLIPRTGVLKTTDSLDTIGFLAAHGETLRPLLDAVRVRGPDYPFVYRHVDSAGDRPKPAGEPWRVGVVRTHTWDGARDYARAAVEDLAKRIAATPGFEVVELPWPDDLRAAHPTHAQIYAKSLAYYFQQEAKSMQKISPVMSQMIEEGRAVPNDAYRAALGEQEHLSRVVDELFSGVDVVLSLGTSSSAPPRHEVELPDPSLIWTLCHVPSIGIPVTRDPAGLPLGVQMTARRWNDYRLLQAVEELIAKGVLPKGSQPVKGG
jgi:Asp-tRNA(Asn)/Glu-tRNA(Gln) amidotransferase A subunit family amidase